MKKTFYLIILFSCLFLFSPASLHAQQTWDLAADWSWDGNPNGTWTYREDTNPLPYVEAWAVHVFPDYDQPAYAHGAASPHYLPAWFQPLVDADTTGTSDWMAGDAITHVDDFVHGVSNVIWICPAGGYNIDISGSMWSASTFGSRPYRWTLFVKDISVATGELYVNAGVADYPRSDPQLFKDKCHFTPDDLIDIDMTGGDEIRLRIEKVFSSSGTFAGANLTISENLEGDNCSNPFIVGTLPYSDTGSTIHFTDQIGYNSPDVWYEWEVETAGNYTISTISDITDYLSQLYIIANDCTTELYSNKHEIGVQAQISAIDFDIGTYYIVIDGDEDLGNYELNVYETEPLPAGSYTIGGTSPDYETFFDAQLDLQSNGISGPVVFNIRGGTYNDELGSLTGFKNVTGASSTNTITFQPESTETEVIICNIRYGIYSEAGYFIFDGIEINDCSKYGILLYSSNNNIIKNCEIYNSNCSDIVIQFSENNLVFNNFIHNQSYYHYYFGTNDGIGILYSNINEIYNNTIYGNYDNGLNIRDGIANVLMNNISYNIYEDGYAVFVESVDPVTDMISDNNDFYAPNGYIGGNLDTSSTYTLLSDWQTATGQDANSISADPDFVQYRTTDLHINPASQVVDGLGTPIVGITTDIDGDTRDPVNPDIGADEYDYVFQPAPIPPHLPIPTNNALNVPIILPSLNWNNGFGTENIDLFFSLDSALVDIMDISTRVISDVDTETYTIPTTLTADTTYFWKVLAKNSNRAVTEGEIWCFSTSYPPNFPLNLQIINSYPDVILQWESVTQNTNGTPIFSVLYSVYADSLHDFMIDSDYLLITQSDTTYTHIDGLLENKMFYKVTAVHDGAVSESTSSNGFIDIIKERD